MGAGISLLRVWASAGSVVAPSSAQIDLGWVVGEQPAVEWENERMYSRDSKVNEILGYLNTGVPLSDVLIYATDIIRMAGTAYASQMDIDDIFCESLGAFGSDAYRTGISKEGNNFTRTTIGSTVLEKQSIAVDVSGSTWSLLRTITTTGTSMYVHRINSAVNFKIGGSPTGDSRILSAMVYDGNDGYTPFYIYSDYVPASNAIQVDQLDVITYSSTPPSFDTLIVDVAKIAASTTPV
jgi:hypothetical protein